MRLSIIIPALNEADNIAVTLALLQAMRGNAEIILVDGGSVDATVRIAAPLVDRVIVTEAGRARQMNAGAKVANGATLLFLHADSLLPANADEMIARALAAGALWGRFDVRISGRHWMLPMIAWLMNQRSRWSGIATGDQGIFVDRCTFDRVGGFPDQPLMEDIAISTRLKVLSAPACLRARIVTSGRRWERHGVWRTIVLMWRLRWQYYRGADPRDLHSKYHGR